jgi:NAD(P)-dependent dehydrogenase (short-subunit alcohol dehydrogenase family)
VKLKELFDLSGRVALITGGSRGLGLDMADALGELGARVVIVARKADELAQAKAELARRGVQVVTAVCDVAKVESLEPMLQKVIAALGPVDILVNNAGTSWGAPAEDYPLDGWRKVVELNMTGAWVLTQLVGARCMIGRRTGRIINIASIAGVQGVHLPEFRAVGYHASNGGLIAMTRALAGEWGRHGITVNAICPGFIPTKMSQGVLDRIEAAVVEMTPLGRLGASEDLKGIVALLASDASRHITGQAICVDGGLTAV